MKTPESIIAKLAREYETFTRSEKKITDYILLHQVEAQYMTITELAEKCGVGEATLTRFCRTLGCHGFGGFKLALAKDNAPVLSSFAGDGIEVDASDTVDALCLKLYTANQEALTMTYHLINPALVVKAVDILEKARRVCCCGQGGSSIMAMEAWGRFITVTNKVQWIQDSHMQAMGASLLEKDDAILFFSFSGATKDLMDVARIAREREVRLILVTGSYTAPAAVYADVVLLCGAVEGPLQMGSVAAKVSQMFLIDVLHNEFCRRDPHQCAQNHEVTLDALSGKYL